MTAFCISIINQPSTTLLSYIITVIFISRISMITLHHQFSNTENCYMQIFKTSKNSTSFCTVFVRVQMTKWTQQNSDLFNSEPVGKISCISKCCWQPNNSHWSFSVRWNEVCSWDNDFKHRTTIIACQTVHLLSYYQSYIRTTHITQLHYNNDITTNKCMACWPCHKIHNTTAAAAAAAATTNATSTAVLSFCFTRLIFYVYKELE